MYFELQMSGAVFARAVRNRLRSIPLAVDLSFPDPNDATNMLVVDQVIIGDNTTIQREQKIVYTNNVPQLSDAATQSVWIFSPQNLFNITVPFVQVKQEVTVLLVRPSDLEKNGPAPSAPAQTLTISPVFNISLQAANQTQGGGPLTLSYALAYVDFGVAGLVMNDAQRAQVAQVIGGVQLNPSTIDLSALTGLLGRSVSAINAGFACDPSGTRVALRADFDVYASPIALSRDFFEAGPADILSGKDWAMLMDAQVLSQGAEQRIKDSLKNKANMRILSDPAGSWDAAETTLRITAGIKLLAVCPSFIDDINMDVRIDLGARFGVPTPNNLLVHYQLDSAPSNNDQVFGCALTGALLWPFAGVALLEQKQISLTDYLGGMAFGPFVSFGQLVGVINGQRLEDDISESLGKTCHKINDSEYECTSMVNMVIQLVPTLNSRFVLDWAHGVPEGLVLSGPVANLGELARGSLGDIGLRPFKWQVLGNCTGNGKNNFRVGNEARIFVPAPVVKARVLDDPDHGYTLANNDGEITVTPKNPPVAYACKIRLITNLGVRTITFAAAKPLGQGEAKDLDKALLGASLTCYYWEKNFTVIEKILWRVDPAFHEIERGAVRQWQILLKELDPTSTLTVRTPDGATVATGRASRSGTLHLSLMFADKGGPPELNLELKRPESSAKPVEVSVRQTLFSLRASLPVQGQIRRLEFTGALRQPHLHVTTDGQTLRWDVRNALAPQLLEATARQAVSTSEEEEPIFHKGREVGGEGTPNITKALAHLFDRLGNAHAIGIPSVFGFVETLYLRTEQGAAIYDISVPEQPQEIHALSSPGWYEDTAATQHFMARHDRARHVIDLYEVVARHIV